MTITKKLRQFAAAALMLAAPSAHAALPYTDGDLILGFRATGGQGGTTSYEVNLGSATQFVGVATSFTVATGGSIATDLEAIYGADWKTRADVFWSVSGTQLFAANGFANRTIFATKAEPTAGTQSIPWARAGLGTQGPAALKLQDLSLGYTAGTASGQTESTNSTKALVQDNGAANSYASHMPGGVNSTAGSAYGFFANGGIENTFGAGTLASVVDLYQLTPGSAGSPSTLLGAFRLNDSGVLTFSPDPSVFGSGPGNAEVSLSLSTYTVQEDGGMAVVTVNRAGNKTTAVSVTLTTTDGTATLANDYTAQNVSVNFAANEETQTVNIPIVDRAGFQGNRAFSVSIAGTAGVTVTQPSSAAITIIENDPQPGTLELSAATLSVAENVGNAVITINRTGSTSGPASVTFSTAGNTAVAGTDFTAVNTTVNFADTEGTKTVEVPILNRAAFQGNRAFSATISSPTGAVLGTTVAADVTILEDEPALSFALTSTAISVSEAAGTVDITVVRSGDTDTVSTIYFETSQGTALETRDYNPFDTTVVFGVGETTKTLSIFLYDVPGFQGSRTLNATFGPPSVGSFTGSSTAAVTITDNDSAPSFTTSASPGSYSGLLKSVPAATLNNTGALTLKVTPKGTFTGKVFIGGTALSISGTFDQTVNTATSGVATFKGATPLPLALKAKPAPIQLGNFAMTIFGDSIVGTLTNGNAVISNVTAERTVPYDGKTPQTTVPATILDATTKGFHTGVIPSETQGALTNDKFPQGDGVFSFTVSKKGAFKVKGTLADGTKFSAGSALNKLNSAPLFAQLYKKKGSFSVDLKFDATRNDSDALGANALWIRPLDPAAKHYPDGWPAGITLDVLAARYLAPQKTDTSSVFPGPLGAENPATGNAALTAENGKLPAPATYNVNISTKNKVTTATSVTDKGFKLKFDAKKGGLAGSFTHTDLTKPKFTGIVFQKGPTKGGYGFFLSTKPKLGPTGEGGGITLLAK